MNTLIQKIIKRVLINNKMTYSTDNIEGILKRLVRVKVGYVHQVEDNVVTILNNRSGRAFGVGDRLLLSRLEISNDDGVFPVVVVGRVSRSDEGKNVRLERERYETDIPHTNCRFYVEGILSLDYQLIEETG